jgi:thiamine pyrophosphate-dependent acetolactate synthase large subunit-like protein
MSGDTKKIHRPEILSRLSRSLKETDIVVVALGGTTADCFQTMHRPGNLYLVGMGMVSQVGLGLAFALPKWRVIVLDTDGGILLAPSIFPVIAVEKPRNLYVLVFDNEQLYGSRGGPKSQTAFGTDLAALARAAGIEKVDTLRDAGSLDSALSGFLSGDGPSVLIAKIEPTIRGKGPKMNGQENKFQLIRHIERVEKKEILGPPKP